MRAGTPRASAAALTRNSRQFSGVSARARRDAVAAACSKAELYAEAAGARLGPVLHIDDVDPESAGLQQYRGHAMGGPAGAQDLAPGHVVVSAAVILGFAIIHD
jgi:uncharacterized protein